MGLQLLSCAWGAGHVELFKNVALRSLLWPKNLAALKELNTKWNVYTSSDELLDLQAYCESVLPGIKFNVKPITELRDYIDNPQSAIVKQIENCLETKDKLLFVPPDIIFGDGSVSGLWLSGVDPHSVVVSAHSRSTHEIIKHLESPLTNAELVTLSFRHLHECWVHAEAGHPQQCTYMGGVEWFRQGNLIIGEHRLPSPYLIDFTEVDLRYFQDANSFGNFDWKWPGDGLVQTQRIRYAASSDIAYMVEITDAEKNLPPIYENKPRTGFHRNDPHNHLFSMILFTFRMG